MTARWLEALRGWIGGPTLTPGSRRRLYTALAVVLMAIGLVLCAEYFGFFRMVDFYLYEDYE